ncbi:MAG: TonB-dependent receptor [Bacteroidia bacterium]|nr:TonB-dependent receptor [Bacteroidia bacterium]
MLNSIFRISTFLFLIVFIPFNGFSQEQKFTLSGEVKDAKNGEDLIGATISIPAKKLGVTSNAYGFYSISLPAGTYDVEVSYLGYITQKLTITLNQNQRKNIELSEDKKELKELVIKTDKADKSNVESNKMSVVKLDIKQVKRIPILLGEVDIIKAVQLLPGVQQAGDGSTLFTVRGGNIDHNLVLLDEAVVYNPSHVLGFFSVFNGDAIKDFEIYKGGIPAQYGGRLASVLDVRMRDGNTKNFGASGGIGLLSSRLTVEGPLVKDKGSFLVSGRRSYFDVFFPLSESTKDASAWFGDLNIKANYNLGEKDKIFVSGYLGRDKLGFGEFFGFGWGNYTGTLRWNHIFNNKLFVNTSLVYSRYDYGFDLNISDNLNFRRSNFINDLNLKAEGNYFISPSSSIKFGTKQTYYKFDPGVRTKITENSVVDNASLPSKRAFQQDYFVSHSYKFNSRLSTEYGARISVFSNVGEGRRINYLNGSPTVLENGFLKESEKDPLNPYTNYASGDIYNTYTGFEPRVALTYLASTTSSVKASFNRMFQYMHLIQNVTASTGQEFWTPSDNYIKPQQADQIALGYFKNFNDNLIETSVELYYKWMNNTVELRDGADIQFNEAIEGQIIAGKGRAYGAEFFVRKPSGRTTGWISYALSKSERKADNINNGDWYNFRFDRTHYLTVVLSHELTERIAVSGNFVYATGEAFTMPSQRYSILGAENPVIYYSERNGARMPAYHRMDFSVTLGRKKIPGKVYKNESNWVFSVYNVYGRKNAYTLSYENDSKGNPIVQKWYLFTFVPSVTYNFKF